MATTCVAVLPVVLVWVLLAEGVISSPWVCLGLAIALSLAASAVGTAYWKRRGGHGDVLFSELLLWGWLHRYRAERRIANSVDLLGLANPGPGSAQTEEGIQRKAQILRQMAAALDAQDPYTDGHSRRVALHSAMIARKMGLPGEEVAKVRTAAAVHDIGKLRTPPEVLHKPGSLTTAEFDLVKRHVDDGAEIVSVMEDSEITATVRHHHERFDGHGYPTGLVGRQTPVAARIIAVADTFDALTSVRPYRPAIPHKKALAIIVDASGTQLDPMAVRAFLKCYSGRRWMVFWAMLAASPQRAFSGLTGTRPDRPILASAATAAGPVAVTAVVAAAVGTAGNVGRTHEALKVAQRASAEVAPGPSVPIAGGSGAHRRASRHVSSPANPLSAPAKVVPAISGTRQHDPKVPATPPSGTRFEPRSRPDGSRRPTPGGTRQQRGAGTGSGPTRKGGGGSPNAGGGEPLGSPTPGGTGGTGVVSGTTSTATPAPGPGPPAGSGSTGGTPGGTGTGGATGSGDPGNGGSGSGGGNGSGGSGGGSGAGGGSGSGGGGDPQSKADCMNGGFVGFGFRNQGQCIAWVENNILH